MSFEGYYQILCRSGHLHGADCYSDDSYDRGWRCHCGEPKAWVNLVDVTNGSFEVDPDTGEEERIDGFVELEILVPPQECVCSCGNKHYSTHGVYRIPDDARRVEE